MANIEAETCSC